jgi:predicted dehydrogenase
MSAAWLRAAASLPDLAVSGLVDVVPAAAQARQKEFGLGEAVVGTDLRAVLRQAPSDIVFNCTIPEAHHSVSTTALRAGCHVLSEKPLAASMVQARAIVAAAKKARRLFAVTQNYRYTRQIRHLRAVVQSGEIGEIQSVLLDFQLAAHFGGFRDEMKHVLLLDMSIHHFDLVRFVSGCDARAVYCHEWNPVGSWYRHDACAHAIFEMSRGVVFNYRGSWCAEGPDSSWNGEWRIVGTKGSVMLRDGKVTLHTVTAGGKFRSDIFHCEPVPGDYPGQDKGHESIVHEFVRCVREGGTPETNGADNLRSLAMVFGAIDSARRRRRIAVKA